MKTYTIKYLLIIITFVLFGCKGYLDTQPLTLPGDKSYYSTPDEIQAAVLSLYNRLSLSTVTANDQPFHLGVDHVSDDMEGGGYFGTIAGGTIQNDDASALSLWTAYFAGIAQCNLLLDGMIKAKEVTTPQLYSQIESEARVMRAKIYLDLATHFGGVPILTKILTQIEYRSIDKSDRNTVFDFVIKELSESANNLPLTYAGDDYGRFTRGAALGLAARASLYAAFFKNSTTPDPDLLNKVIAFTDTIINRKVYTLYPDYQKLFMYAGEHSTETVISECYNTVALKTHKVPYNFLPLAIGGIVKFRPLENLIDAYECIDGLPIDKSSLYDPKNPFKNRDPRLAKSIVLPRVSSSFDSTTIYPGTTLWNGREYKTTLLSTLDKSYLEAGVNVANPDVTSGSRSPSGYAIQKYCDPLDLTVLQASQIDVMIMRYAEILLMNAEARIERNTGDDLAKAADYLNLIKARAYGLSPVAFASHAARVLPSLTQKEMRKRLRMERRMELTFEGLRYNDLRRWGIAVEVLNTDRYGRPTNFWDMTDLIPTIDDNGIPKYSAAIIAKIGRTGIRTYTTKFLLLPIPLDEYLLNNKLGQNPEY